MTKTMIEPFFGQPQFRAPIIAHIALGCIGRPENVVGASVLVSGAALIIDGDGKAV